MRLFHDAYNIDGSGQYTCGAQQMNADGGEHGRVDDAPLRAQIDWGTAPQTP